MSIQRVRPDGSAKPHMRAMPLARLTGNGMDQPDAAALHAMAAAGVAWHTAAEDLGDRNLERARIARRHGHHRSARERFFLASACYRFGQVPLADDHPSKRRLYRRMLDAFQAGGGLGKPRYERVDIPWRHGTISGWLVSPARPGPVVLQLSGIAGSREEYETGSRYLVARGIGAALIDMPGQGEARLFGGLHFDGFALDAVRAVVDAVSDRPACDGRVAVWGNSAGGWLALLAAAVDPRLRACCVTGGTDRPTEILDRFPRFITEFQRMTGHEDPSEARAVFDRLAIDAELLDAVRCPLHVVHGTPDRVFNVNGARRIYGGAGSDDKLLTEFADGDHCVTNRSHEKHTIVADWFADRLTPELTRP